jgi:hypothetical protein
MAAQPSIFISYRKDDSISEAGRLEQSLVLAFGKGTVFYDRNRLKPGMEWDKELEEKVSQAKIVIPLIKSSGAWLGVNIDDGERRIDDENDWVRKELEAAIQLEKIIIPVFIEQGKFPKEQALPESLRRLTKKQGYPVRLDFWENDINVIIQTILDILSELKPESVQETKKSEPAPTIRIPSHLKFTCDRKQPFGQFTDWLMENQGKRTLPHFFFLSGDEAHAHLGLFERIVARLKGVDHLAYDDSRAGYQVRDFKITMPEHVNLLTLLSDTKRKVLSELGVLEADMAPLEEKTLAFALQNGSKLIGLTEKDKLCIHITICSSSWHPSSTPLLAVRFIEGFVNRGLPETSPQIIFFFSVEHELQNTDLKAEIESALREALYVHHLGKLELVTPDDITAWFQQNKEGLPETKSARDQLRLTYFGANSEDKYMDEVQLQLGKLIKHINEQDNYENRNS